MPNQSGNVYGLTILSQIVNGADGDISHDCAIRDYLADLPRDHRSLFAKVSSTHLARLVVMDDVVFRAATKMRFWATTMDAAGSWYRGRSTPRIRRLCARHVPRPCAKPRPS